MTPTVGRIVHYVSYGTPGGEFATEHRAAIITACAGNDDTTVSLCVLNPTGMFFNEDVPYSIAINQHGIFASGGSWHWPERD